MPEGTVQFPLKFQASQQRNGKLPQRFRIFSSSSSFGELMAEFYSRAVCLICK